MRWIDAECAASRYIGAHPALGRLFRDNDLSEQAQAAAAVLFGRRHAPKPGRARFNPQRLQIAGRKRIAIVRLPLFHRANFVRHEAANSIAQHDEMLRQIPSTANFFVNHPFASRKLLPMGMPFYYGALSCNVGALVAEDEAFVALVGHLGTAGNVAGKAECRA